MDEGRGRGSCFPRGSQDTERSGKIMGAICTSPGHVSDGAHPHISPGHVSVGEHPRGHISVGAHSQLGQIS